MWPGQNRAPKYDISYVQTRLYLFGKPGEKSCCQANCRNSKGYDLTMVMFEFRIVDDSFINGK